MPNLAKSWPCRGSADRHLAGQNYSALRLSNCPTCAFQSGNCLMYHGSVATTEEQLAGYNVIEVPNVKAVLSWAARSPASWGRNKLCSPRHAKVERTVNLRREPA
ncbi:hypothetical protein CFBP6625_27955 (plasmid) [Agrobacterium tumefaciens]|nr:hypothetical protein CFBP6625_27955 [Agrobacterium tumefaciens]